MPDGGPASPSGVFDVGIRRAAIGLFVAGAAQTFLSLPFTAAAYESWWSVGLGPALLLLIGGACAAGLRATSPAAGDRWIVALCALTLVTSLTASVANVGVPLRGANAAVPLVQLGAFGAGLAPGLPTWATAFVMVIIHRVGLVATGAGSTADHVTSAAWEAVALAAAAAGGFASRRVAGRMDAAAAELAVSEAADAAFDYRLAAARRRASLMHDFVLNHLVAIGLGTTGRDFTEQLRATAAELRVRLAAAGRPTRSDRPLGEQVRETVVDVERATGLVVDYEAAGMGPRLTSDVGDGLSLVVAEALRNVKRHSGTNQAVVSVRGREDRWIVTVVDRGVGFDPVATRPGRLGVRDSMVGRAVDLGGVTTIASSPGVGTVVTVEWPASDDPESVTRRQTWRRRWATVGEVMWTPILRGLMIIAAVNLLILLANRSAYRSVWVVGLLWVAMTLVAVGVWYRSRTGIGPGGTLAAVVSAVGGSLLMADQLSGMQLVGPANWVAGYGALALALLPFSRPGAEVVAGASAVLVANVLIDGGAADGVLGRHLAALSAVSAPSIVIGATLLVVQLRRTVETGDRQRDEARLRDQLRAVEAAAADEFVRRREGLEREALELLDEVAAGGAGPAAASRAADVHGRLRTELDLQLRQSYLQGLVLDGLARDAKTRPSVEVRDEANLGRVLVTTARRVLVTALQEASGNAAVVAAVHPAIDEPGQAHVIVRVVGPGPPATPAWRHLYALPGTQVTMGPQRCFVQLHLPLRPDLRRVR